MLQRVDSLYEIANACFYFHHGADGGLGHHHLGPLGSADPKMRGVVLRCSFDGTTFMVIGLPGLTMD